MLHSAAKLRSGYGLKVGRMVDLRTLAATTLGKPALRGAGLQTLVFEVMGVRMEKPHHVRVRELCSLHSFDAFVVLMPTCRGTGTLVSSACLIASTSSIFVYLTPMTTFFIW